MRSTGVPCTGRSFTVRQQLTALEVFYDFHFSSLILHTGCISKSSGRV